MKRLLSLGLAAASCCFAHQDPAERDTDDMLRTLESVRHAYKTRYAPYLWKEELFDWNLDDAVDQAREQISQLAQDNALSLTEFQRKVRDLLMTMRDYHVMITFNRTECARLPLEIRGAEGRYFIVGIDRETLSEDAFPFEVGDEVVSFAGKPTDEVVQDLRRSDMLENVAITDQRLTEMMLTYRPARIGYLVPKGPVSLGVQKKGSESVKSVQLMWRYSEEKVTARGIGTPPWGPPENTKLHLLERLELVSPMAALLAEAKLSGGHSLGSRKSFLPRLGQDLWWESDETDPFDAYIYANEEGKRIGVIRIPSFSSSSYKDSLDSCAATFGELLTMMETKTDALVIDQLNNPGGSVAYLFALLSMLSDQPLDCAWHQTKLNPAEIYESQKDLEQLRKIKTQEDAASYFGETMHGFPMTLEVVLFYRDYLESLIEAWESGEDLTDLHPFWLVDKVPPHPSVYYSKPLLVLINELDFSCGDWFPATLQDNGRATLLGTRTSGAGGCVEWFSFPNNQGIAGMSVTWTLAQRPNGERIENLGIRPDIEVALTADDFQSDYAPFAQAVRDAVNNILN